MRQINLSQKNDLINFLKDADAAIVGLEQIDEYILTKLPKLKIISKYGWIKQFRS